MLSSNPRWSYCIFNSRPCDLEQVLHVAIGSGIIFTKFDSETLWYTKRQVIKVVPNLNKIEQFPAELFIIL